MKTIQQLRAERAELAKQSRNIIDNWPDADADRVKAKADLDAKFAQIERCDEQIGVIEKQLEVEAATDPQRRIDERADRDGIPRSEAERQHEIERGIHMTWLRGGNEALNETQRAHVAERRRRALAEQATSPDSAGGYLVPADFAATLLEKMKAFGGMRTVATVIQTDHGRQIDYPTTNDTAEKGEIVAENSPASDDDIAFGTKNIGAYKYSSKVITVPFELLMDSRIDLGTHIDARLARRIARIVNEHCTVGDGSGKPQGIVGASVQGAVGTTGQTLTVTYGDLVNLEHSVDPAYRANGCGWMFHDSTLKVMKKLEDEQHRPLWRPGVTGKDPDDILGYGYTINQDMPVMAADAKSILFGQLSKYVMRDVMAITLFRFTDSAYTKKGQVGFLAWSRHDGDLMDYDGEAVRHYANSHT